MLLPSPMAMLVVLGADHDLEPDADVVLERDVADQRRVGRDEVIACRRSVGAALADGVERHAAIIMQ